MSSAILSISVDGGTTVGLVRARTLADPIHDTIHLSPRLCQFIDTPQFQRLRFIKQLGTSYYVWSGASHNRFEHSLGVAHLARTLVEHLQRSQPELEIDERDIECVEIAGLCHDLGHGPWSHVFDGVFLSAALSGTTWQHEKGSLLMFDFMIRDNDIDISERDSRFIKALIIGEPELCDAHEKPFLFDIVANKRNGLDVDKFDYIHRDTYMIGAPISISPRRIILSARVLENQVCYDIKDANALYEICATRFRLHKTIYSHRTAKAIEYMISDILLQANHFFDIVASIEIPTKFLYLDDSILSRIESSEDPGLEKTRALCKRIRKRDLYRRVDYKVIDWDLRQIFQQHVTPQNILTETKRIAASTNKSFTEGLNVEHIIVDFSTMHYGMKERNPLDEVKFYSKTNPWQCAKAGRGDYSVLQPPVFAEVYLSIFTKIPDFFGSIQAGYRAILDVISKELTTANDTIKKAGVVPTPPTTEAPSTPQMTSRTPSRTGSLCFGTKSASKNNSFSNNSFTTVSYDYTPVSPTARAASVKEVAKRRRDDSPHKSDDEQILKKKAKTEQNHP